MTTLSIVLLALLQTAAAPARPAPKSALTLVATIPLPGVQGRIGHMTFEPVLKCLFIAALENGTVEIVDTRSKARLGRVKESAVEIRDPRLEIADPMGGIQGPRGAVFVERADTVFVTDSYGWLWYFPPYHEHGASTVGAGPVNQSDHWTLRRMYLDKDADSIRYLPKTDMLLVGFGEDSPWVNGGLASAPNLAFVTVEKPQLTGTIDLGGHPESFQVNAAETRAWVNVPSTQSIAVVDLEARRVLRSIELKGAKRNYAMALAESERRLLVGCREPSKLLVFDIDTDALVAELPISVDVDDMFVDADRGLVYASCSSGFLDVFERTGPGAWKPREQIATAIGARTCLFVASERRLFLAVPHREDQQPEIRVFSTAP